MSYIAKFTSWQNIHCLNKVGWLAITHSSFYSSAASWDPATCNPFNILCFYLRSIILSLVKCCKTSSLTNSLTPHVVSFSRSRSRSRSRQISRKILVLVHTIRYDISTKRAYVLVVFIIVTAAVDPWWNGFFLLSIKPTPTSIFCVLVT